MRRIQREKSKLPPRSHHRDSNVIRNLDEEDLLRSKLPSDAANSFTAPNLLSEKQAFQTTQKHGFAREFQQTQGNLAFLNTLNLIQRQENDLQNLSSAIQKQDGPGAETGNPVAPPEAGTSIHPTVRQGSTGPAVEELQEKLNQSGVVDPPLVVDGIFGPKTLAATRAFQSQYGLAVDGVVGPITWGKMDELGLSSDVGRVNRSWSEQVGGVTYSMTSRYTWRITDQAIRITVKLKFTGQKQAALISTLFDAIRNTWNRFAAIDQSSGEALDIIFEPVSVESGEDNIVRLRPGNSRSDAANWYIGDPDINETASHEFGHMVGLEDEYQRTHRDYKRLTGEEPPAGQTTNAADPAVVAQQLHDALRKTPTASAVTDSNGVITNNHLEQGDYASQVAAAYQAAFNVEIVSDIVSHIPDNDQWSIVDPFTYSSGSIMGMATNHSHPVEPRHVREFVGYIQALKGSVWKAKEK